MRRSILVGFSLVLSASALAVAGCGASAEALDSTAIAQGRSTAPLEFGKDGPLRVVGEAFGEVALGEAQRAEIEKLATDAVARHAPVREARLAVATAIADQVAAGKLDRAALEPLFAKVDAAAEGVKQGDVDALQRLHDLLDEGQRQALVDAIEARFKEAQGAGGFRDRMKAAADRIGLTEDQRDHVKDALKGKLLGKAGDFKQRMSDAKDALESFAEDDFDPNAILSSAGARRGAMRDGFLDVLDAVVPELTAEQREKAAALIREKVTEMDG